MEVKNEHNWTALNKAAKRGYMVKDQLLIDKDACVNAVTEVPENSTSGQRLCTGQQETATRK